MNITTSPDISVLQVQVTWNISGDSPVINLVNMSEGANLANISYAFFAASPSQTPIHTGNINSPDVTGVWSTFNLTESWPAPFNQIEWSGAPYTFYVVAKDSTGALFTTPVQNATICRPNGNTQTTKNFYGKACSTVQVKCEQARIFFQDITNSSYKGLTGTLISSTLKMLYPIDGTGNQPAPFTAVNYVTALVPITFSSDAYQYLQTAVYDYDFGNYAHVRIKYLSQSSRTGTVAVTFPVYCNIDLGVLQCEITKLIDQVESGNCTDVVSATKKLQLITSKFVLVTMGILQPLTGIDVPALIDEIQVIGGFQCDCCNAPTGIIPNPTSLIDGYAFSVHKLGGSISTASNFSVSGNNITLNIGDVTYIVTVNSATTTALTIAPTTSGDGFTTTYQLNLDANELALELATAIQNNADTYNIWNALFGGNADFDFVVDGKCIFESTAACDYAFTLENIPASSTYAIVTGIKTGNTNKVLNYQFNQTNLALLQTYLNSLNIGTFTVTNGGSGNVSITSDANTNQLSNLTYKITSANYLATQTTDCTGFVPIPANEFGQYIVDYLCGLTDAQIVTSAAYTICYVDNNGAKQTQVIASDTSLSVFIAQLLATGCQTIDYIINNVSGVNCTNMVSLFKTNTNKLDANSLLYGFKGICAGISPLELFQYMLTLNDSATKALFCDYVASCGAGLSCEAINFDLLITPHDTSCSNIVGIVFSTS